MRARLAASVLIAGALAVPSAQQPAPAPPPAAQRADATFVRLDMYATRDEMPVSDLGRDEVKVVEDGVAQTLVSLERVDVRPVEAVPGTGPEPEPGPGAGSRARVFVIFIDTLHTQLEGTAAQRLPLVRFLDRLLAPGDLVALVTSEMPAVDLVLGTKASVMANLTQDDWSWVRDGRGGVVEQKDKLYDSCYPDRGETTGAAREMKSRRRERLTLDALDGLVQRVRGLRDERKAVIVVTDGWRTSTEDRQLASGGGARGRRESGVRGPFGREPRVESRPTSSAASNGECEANRLTLALANNSSRLRELTENANRATVSIYPVSPLGLLGDSAPPFPATASTDNADGGLAARLDTLRQLAAETDAVSVLGTRGLDSMLRRIGDDLSSYYLLGYYSSNAKLDGRFRSVTVRVTRPDVRVRTRRGYRAHTPAELTQSVLPVGTDTRAVSTIPAGRSNPLRMRTSTWTRDEGDAVAGSAWLVAELDYALRKDFTWTAGASAEVVLVAATGQEVLSRTLDVDASVGMFSLRLPETGTLPVGEYALRVRVRPSQEGAAPLSDTGRLIVADRSTVLGDAVLWRRGRSTGPRYLMTAEPRFRRDERIRFEYPTDLDGAASARLLDRQGSVLPVPVSVADRLDESGQFRWVAADLALAPLATGEYAIEMLLGGTKVVTPFQVVP